MGQIYRGVTLLICNGAPVNGLSDSFLFIGQGYMGSVPIPVIIMLVIAVGMALFMSRTVLGRHIILMGGNAEAARISGVNTKWVQNAAYMITGLCVAIAAVIMDGRVGSGQPTAGTGMEMDAIAAVVIGGTPLHGGSGNVIGSIMGALIVGVINNGLNLVKVNTYWQMAAKGILILVAIILDEGTNSFMRKKQAKAAK